MTFGESASALEHMAERRDVALLGRDWLRDPKAEADSLWAELGIQREAPRPLTWPVTHYPKVVAALVDHGLDPAEIEERELAGAIGELAPLLALPLWDEYLRPSGLLEWWPPRSLHQVVFGHGFLMDVGARRLLGRVAGIQPGAELWVTFDAPDFLTAATYWSETDERERGVLGIVDGRWPHGICRRIPDGATVLVTPGPCAPAVFASARARALTVRPWQPAPRHERCA